LTSSPVVFADKGKTLVAVAAKDGSVQLLDAASLSKLAASSAGTGAGPLAVWQDAAGTTWILSGSTAWKFTGNALETGWTASNITAPVASAVVNGVVFLAARTTLYALDAATGKSFWTSGNTITSPIPRQGGLAAGGSAVYLGTQDGTFYAFGFPIEH
jgi:outer membrane protein assembly factor BamB